MVKDPPANAGDIRDLALIPGSGRSPGRGYDNPLQYSCPENPHGQRSLAGYSPWGRKELDMTTTATFDLQQVIPKTTLAGSHLITLSGRDLLVHRLSVGAWLCLQAAQGCGSRPHVQGEEGRWHMLKVLSSGRGEPSLWGQVPTLLLLPHLLPAVQCRMPS